MTLLDALKRRLHNVLATVVVAALSVLTWLMPAVPTAHAESLNTQDTPEYQQLIAELNALQAKEPGLSAAQSQRLGDLQQLDTAIATANDRATLTNATTHNLGLFARYKKDPADQPASFYVLAPGHQSDDDFAVTALYLPAQVELSWESREPQAIAEAPRVVSVLPGEALEVRDAQPSSASVVASYALNLPAYALQSKNDALVAVTPLTQDELDAQPETAPVD